MMGWNGGPGWVSWLLMSLGMVAFWVLLVLAIMVILPGVHDERKHRRRPRRGGIR